VLIAAGDLRQARFTLREAAQCAWEGGYIYFVMIAFYYFAELLEVESGDAGTTGALSRRRFAVTLLGCVGAHIATWAVFRNKAARLLAALEGTLPPAAFVAAQHEGESNTVEALVEMVIDPRRDMLNDPWPVVSTHQNQDAVEERAPATASVNGAFDDLRPTAQFSALLFEPLTPRERDVLRLLAAGESNQEIATQLTITPGTAKWYVSQIFGKLGVRSRTQAAVRARELKLLP
jgi:DNA-binding NarL/FixJ family response regulator